MDRTKKIPGGREFKFEKVIAVYIMPHNKILEALQKVEGLNDVKELSPSNFMMKIRIFLALFHDMRLPCAKRLDRVIETFRRSKRNSSNLLEDASTLIYKELEALGLNIVGTRPAALLQEKCHKSFLTSLKSLLRYRKTKRGGGDSSEKLVLLSSPEEKKSRQRIISRRHQGTNVSNTVKQNQRSRRHHDMTTMSKSTRKKKVAVPSEWEDEIRALREEVEMLRGVITEFMEEKEDEEDKDLIRTILMQQRELRAQNVQLKRQLGLYREAIETQDDVISEIDTAISTMHNTETSKHLDPIRERIDAARRRSARAQTSKLISRQADSSISLQGLQILLEKTAYDLHEFIRTQRSGHKSISHVFRSRHEQTPSQLSKLCGDLRRLIRRLGRMGLSLSSSTTTQNNEDDLERDRPGIRDSANILNKLQRDLVSDKASRHRAIGVAMRRLRARDEAEARAYEVMRDEIRALRNARDLEAAYTQRLANRLENANKDPVSNLFNSTHAIEEVLIKHDECLRLASELTSTTSVVDAFVTLIRGGLDNRSGRSKFDTFLRPVLNLLMSLESYSDTLKNIVYNSKSAARKAEADLSVLKEQYERERQRILVSCVKNN